MCQAKVLYEIPLNRSRLVFSLKFLVRFANGRRICLWRAWRPCKSARRKELCTTKNRISRRGDIRRKNRRCRHKTAGLWYTIRRCTQLERLTHRLARWEPGKFLCKSQTKREGASFGRVFPPLILQGFPGPPSGHGRGKRPFPFRDRGRANLGKENMKATDGPGKRVCKAGNPHVLFDEGEVAPAATPRRGFLLYKKQRRCK